MNWARIPFALIIGAIGIASLPAQKVRKPTAAAPVTLQSAIADGKVEATTSGTGASSGDAIRLRVRKTAKAGAGALAFTVPAGTMLSSSSVDSQSMVVKEVRGIDLGNRSFRPTSQVVLRDGIPVTLILSAFCAEFEKENPTAGSAFSISNPDPMLACIMQEGKGLSLAGLQAAVWIHTDAITYRKMTAKFGVNQTEFAAGQAAVERCRAKAQ